MNELDPTINLVIPNGYDNIATFITLDHGYGRMLQDPSITGSFNLIWWNSSDYMTAYLDPFFEIIRCIAKYDDTLVVMRGQDGTSVSEKNLEGKIYKMAPVAPVSISPDIGTLSFYNAPQTHGKTKHDPTTVDGGAALSSNTQIPAHGSSQHTGIIGDHVTQLTSIGTNSHAAIDTHISTNLTGVHGISGTPSSGQILTATSSTAATWQNPAAGTSPATTVVSETSFSQAAAVGTSTLYARGDHTHGTPSDTPFEHIINKNQPSGYAGLNPNTLVWPLQIYPSLEEYSNHLGTVDNFTQTAISGNGTASSDATNHMMTLSSGLTVASYSTFDTKKTWILGTNPIVANILVQNITAGGTGSLCTHVGLSGVFGVSYGTMLTTGSAVCFKQDPGGSWYAHTANGSNFNDIGISAIANGNLATVVSTSSMAYFYVNGSLVASTNLYLPTTGLNIGTGIGVGAGITTARTISVDMLGLKVYK